MEPCMIEVRKNGLRLDVERLEERAVPSHLNPGVGEVVLPPAACYGEGGIAVAMASPRDHRSVFILTECD